MNWKNKIMERMQCQSYGRGAYPAEITEAVDSIFYTNNDGSKLGLVLMHKPTVSTYNYICAFHFSSCGGNGTKTVSGIPYLKEKSCSDLISGLEVTGRGYVSVAQQRWRKMGKDVKISLRTILRIPIRNFAKWWAEIDIVIHPLLSIIGGCSDENLSERRSNCFLVRCLSLCWNPISM